MKINVTGDALVLLEDFIRYAELDPDAMADLMYYDPDGFRQRLERLKEAVGE